LLNLIIHSIAFAELVDDKETTTAFWVTSERFQSTLWEIDISKFTKLMRYVADDQPSHVEWVRDPDTDQLLEWRGTGEMPFSMQEKFVKIRKRYRLTE